MNLRDIQTILSKIEFAKIKLSRTTQGNNPVAANINSFKNFLRAVEPLPLFTAEKTYLLQSPLYTTSRDTLQLDSTDFTSVFNVATTIHDGFSTLYKLLDAVLPPIDADSVVIKIPEPPDFEAAIEYQSEIFRAISQNVVNDEIAGKVILKEWEPGSFWLTLYLGSVAAVGLVGGLTWSAAVVLKKFQEYKMFVKMTDGLEIRNEALQELQRGVERSVDLLLDTEAKSLIVENFRDSNDNERVARLRMGIKTFMGLIEKGAEIHPSLKAPEKVQNLFPDFSKLSLIETRTRQIENTKPSASGPDVPGSQPH